MSEPPIYLDYNATTPVDPAVLAAMLPYLEYAGPQSSVIGHFGNPSSAHAYGKAAHDAVEAARAQVAALIGAQADEIVFTGGGSEASNHAIKGACFAHGRPDSAHLITTGVEHPATARPVEFLQKLGAETTVLPVDRDGMIDLGELATVITHRTRLVSIMHSNNEVGTLMPIRAASVHCRAAGVLLHTDCAQSLGKVPVDANELGVDLLTIAGHKLYAPKGIGALYVRRGVKLEPLIHGAGHEKGRRAGTENVPYIVGLGKACEVARRSLPAATKRLRTLRDRLHAKLLTALGEKLILNGHPEERLPNTLNVNFVGHIGAELLAKVPGVAASTGSACHEGQVKLSPVLAAMGVPPEVGRGAVRLSVGRFTTEEEVDRAAAMLVSVTRQ
jgi:cysteine desulfurase